jgi:hypothetical protein
MLFLVEEERNTARKKRDKKKRVDGDFGVSSEGSMMLFERWQQDLCTEKKSMAHLRRRVWRIMSSLMV